MHVMKCEMQYHRGMKSKLGPRKGLFKGATSGAPGWLSWLSVPLLISAQHDLGVMGLSPALGSMLSEESALSFSLLLPLPVPLLALSLPLSLKYIKNKQTNKKQRSNIKESIKLSGSNVRSTTIPKHQALHRPLKTGEVDNHRGVVRLWTVPCPRRAL